jgi:uncharacterized protein (DUF486 family)
MDLAPGCAGWGFAILARRHVDSEQACGGRWNPVQTGHATSDRSRRDSPSSRMPAIFSSPYVLPLLLLISSNIFMTIAWYGHLRFKYVPLVTVIFASWGIAFIEYCLAVPDYRYGHAVYSAAELKTLQEVITLVVFSAFSIFYLQEPIGWNHAVGFSLIAAGAFFVFLKW